MPTPFFGIIGLSLTTLIILSVLLSSIFLELWLVRTDTYSLRDSWNQYAFAVNGEMDYMKTLTLENYQPSFEKNKNFFESMWQLMSKRSNVYGKEKGTPIAAVVVEPMELPLDSLSAPYKQRLIDSYRLALLGGSPWVILAGDTAQCAMALNYLNQLPHPAAVLFPEDYVVGLPPFQRQVAEQLNRSLEKHEHLFSWTWQQTPLSSLNPTGAMTRDGDYTGDAAVERLANDLVAEQYRAHGVSIDASGRGDEVDNRSTYIVQSGIPRKVTLSNELQFIVPGIILAENNKDPYQTQKRVSDVFFAVALSSYNAVKKEKPKWLDQFWLRNDYAVLVMASSIEQMHMRLLYQSSFRDSHSHLFKHLQSQMQHSIVRHYYAFNVNGNTVPSAVKDAVSQVLRNTDFTQTFTTPKRILTTHSLGPFPAFALTEEEEASHPSEPQASPHRLPPGSNPNCHWLLRYIGGYAHYIHSQFLLLKSDVGYSTELIFFQIFQDLDSKRISIADAFLSIFK